MRTGNLPPVLLSLVALVLPVAFSSSGAGQDTRGAGGGPPEAPAESLPRHAPFGR